jgi:hypothetical protein
MKYSLIFLFCLIWFQQILAQDQIKIEGSTIKLIPVKEDISEVKLIPYLANALNIYNKSIETGEPAQRIMNNQRSTVNDGYIHMLSPGVYFSLDGGWGSYSGNATINFDGSDYAYDPALGGTLIYCNQGTYSYIITPADASKAINRGTVTVSSNNLVTVKIEIADAHRIDIIVNDQNLKVLQGALVKFDGVTLFTDETGLASFDRYPLGTYTYSVSNPGYISLEDQTLQVMAQVERIMVTLKQFTYAATFKVTSGTNILEGAGVTLQGTELFTNAEGMATFSNLTVGTYEYTVTQTGYMDETGNISIADGDVVRNVDLLSISGLVESSAKSVKLYPNPTSSNLFVSLPENHGKEITIRITNLIGSVLLENKATCSSNQIKLDLSGYDNGVYFVKVIGNRFENTIKVVKR